MSEERDLDGFHAVNIDLTSQSELAPGFVCVTLRPAVLLWFCVPTGRPEMPYAVGKMVCRPEDVLASMVVMTEAALFLATDPDVKKDQTHTIRRPLPIGETMINVTLSDRAIAAANQYLRQRYDTEIARVMPLYIIPHMMRTLMLAPDDPAIFPGGKWATIQAFESDMLQGEQAARREGE